MSWLSSAIFFGSLVFILFGTMTEKRPKRLALYMVLTVIPLLICRPYFFDGMGSAEFFFFGAPTPTWKSADGLRDIGILLYGTLWANRIYTLKTDYE